MFKLVCAVVAPYVTDIFFAFFFELPIYWYKCFFLVSTVNPLTIFVVKQWNCYFFYSFWNCTNLVDFLCAQFQWWLKIFELFCYCFCCFRSGCIHCSLRFGRCQAIIFARTSCDCCTNHQNHCSTTPSRCSIK